MKEKEQEMEIEQIHHAELLMVILNTPHLGPKGRHEVWQVEDFLPEKLRQRVAPKHTHIEAIEAWKQYIRGCERR